MEKYVKERRAPLQKRKSWKTFSAHPYDGCPHCKNSGRCEPNCGWGRSTQTPWLSLSVNGLWTMRECLMWTWQVEWFIQCTSAITKTMPCIITIRPIATNSSTKDISTTWKYTKPLPAIFTWVSGRLPWGRHHIWFEFFWTPMRRSYLGLVNAQSKLKINF